MSGLNLHKVYMESVDGNNNDDINDANKVVVDVVDKKEGTGDIDTPPSVGDTGEIDKVFDKQDIKSLDDFAKDAEASADALVESTNDINDFERALERIAAYQEVGAWSAEEAETKLNEIIHAACPFSMEDFSLEEDSDTTKDVPVKKGIFKDLGEKINNTNKLSSLRRQLNSLELGYKKLDIYGEFKGVIDEAYKDEALMSKITIKYPNTKFITSVKHIDITIKEYDNYQKTIFSIVLKAFENILKASTEEEVIVETIKARDQGYTAINNLTLIDFSMVERTWLNKIFKTKNAQEVWWKGKSIQRAFMTAYEPNIEKDVLIKDVIPNPSDISIISKSNLSKIESALNKKSSSMTKGSVAIDGSIVAAKSKLKGDKLASFKLKNAVSISKNLVESLIYVSEITEEFCGEIIYAAQDGLLKIVEAKANSVDPKIMKAFKSVVGFFTKIAKRVISNKSGINIESSNRFEVALGDIPSDEDVVVKRFISMENAPGTTSGTDNAKQIQDPGDSLLNKIMSNANNNDQLDAKSKADIIKELKGAGYEIDDNGGEYADELSPEAINALSYDAISKVDKLSTESVLDIELESMDLEVSLEAPAGIAKRTAMKTEYKSKIAKAKEEYRTFINAEKSKANEKIAKLKESNLEKSEINTKSKAIKDNLKDKLAEAKKKFVEDKKQAGKTYTGQLVGLKDIETNK